MSLPAKSKWNSEPPTVIIGKPEKEQPIIEVKEGDYESLYEKCWDLDDYRRVSPGEKLVDAFLEVANPFETQTLTDWGCGTGRAGYTLWKDHGLDVTLVDFASNCLDDHVREEMGDRFEKMDLTEKIQELREPSQYGYCTDVLEHIPEEDIDTVLDNILTYSKHVFFQISCMEDHFGGHPDIKGDGERKHLHVCVHDYQWWLKKFVEYGVEVHHSKDLRSACLFFVTSYTGHNFSGIQGRLNVPIDTVIENIKHSATLGLPEVKPYETQDLEIMLLAGGPSLNDFEEEIIQQRKDGMKLITVNGAYNWAVERGLKPSLQFLIDSRDFNKRFVEQSELTEETKYVVSSSADPKVFESLPADRTYLMHTSLSDEMLEVIEEHYGKEGEDFFPVPGGSTVTLRAICALRMLGFYKIHIYGFDNCIREVDSGRQHHAYEQEENDSDSIKAVRLTVAPGSSYAKEFLVAPWMIFQAMDFKKMSQHLMPDILLDVKGDGMIAYMIEVAAKMNDGVDIEIEVDKPPKRAYKQRASKHLKD
jgi:hypothetical protein